MNKLKSKLPNTCRWSGNILTSIIAPKDVSLKQLIIWIFLCVNPLTPNDPYSGRTAPLTSKRCILYIYSTNIGTEYFKHGIYSPFFSSKCSLFHNSNVFCSCIIHILYIGCAKIKKIIIPAPKVNWKFLRTNGCEYFRHSNYEGIVLRIGGA